MTEGTDQAPTGSLEGLGREVASQVRQALALASPQPLAEAKPIELCIPPGKTFFMDEAHLLPWPRGDFKRDVRN